MRIETKKVLTSLLSFESGTRKQRIRRETQVVRARDRLIQCERNENPLYYSRATLPFPFRSCHVKPWPQKNSHRKCVTYLPYYLRTSTLPFHTPEANCLGSPRLTRRHSFGESTSLLYLANVAKNQGRMGDGGDGEYSASPHSSQISRRPHVRVALPSF